MVAYNEVRQEVYYYLFIVEDAPPKKKDVKNPRSRIVTKHVKFDGQWIDNLY
jgi:hypothetical protein